MTMTKELLAILMTAILTENFLLSKFLGICPFLGVSKKLNTASGMSMAVIFVMLLATAVTYPINNFILVPNGLAYLQTIVFILVIAALVQLVEIALKNGALGSKLTGGGRGGCVIALAKTEETAKKIEKAYRQIGKDVWISELKR